MSTQQGALVVFGSGPGVGRNVAAVFAQRGFEEVLVLSRDAKRLAQDANYVRAARAETKVYEIPVDLANPTEVRSCLEKVEQGLESTHLECVFYNAARLGRSEFFDFSSEKLQSDLQIAVVSLYAVAQWAMPRLLDAATSDASTPSLLVSSGMLAKDPSLAVFSLAACKAGQASLAHSLHKQYEPKGVRRC